MTEINLQGLLCLAFMFGCAAGVVRLFIVEVPVTTRTILAYVLSGGLMAIAGVGVLTTCRTDTGSVIATSIMLGMFGEQAGLALGNRILEFMDTRSGKKG